MSNTIASQFDLHTRLFNNVLDDITDSESDKRANENVNHIKWLAGHLVNTRLMMKDMAGLEADPKFAVFEGKLDSSIKYPTLDVIKTKWNEIAGKLSTGLKNLPEQVLNGPAPTKTPIGGDTMHDFLGFLMHHEAYHIGQLGIMRKTVGKEAMKYN
jgi:uncharacterized damage-inducible protein DinB